MKTIKVYQKITLQSISAKYCGMQFNEDNYSVGGGIDGEKFASRRHEDAKSDAGKLTLGEATAMFKKATGLNVDTVQEVIKSAVPNMEWHHAGKLPKSYGGGMKKTYFLNSSQICKVATNWDSLVFSLLTSKEAAAVRAAAEKDLASRKAEFLKLNATQFTRVTSSPTFSIHTDSEYNGKYGWFSTDKGNYNMPKYYSGWAFPSMELLNEYYSII